MRVKGGDIHDGRFGCDAVQLHALCAVLIIIRLSLGGENEAVVVLIPLAGKGAVIFTADIVALLVAALGQLDDHAAAITRPSTAVGVDVDLVL